MGPSCQPSISLLHRGRWPSLAPCRGLASHAALSPYSTCSLEDEEGTAPYRSLSLSASSHLLLSLSFSRAWPGHHCCRLPSTVPSSPSSPSRSKPTGRYIASPFTSMLKELMRASRNRHRRSFFYAWPKLDIRRRHAHRHLRPPRPSRRRLKLRRSLPYLPVDSRVLEHRGSPESGRFPDSGRRRDACCRHHRAVPESADHPAVVEPPRSNGGELLLLLSFLPRPSPSPSPATAPSPCALPPLPPSPHVQHAPGLAPSLAGQKAGWLGKWPGLTTGLGRPRGRQPLAWARPNTRFGPALRPACSATVPACAPAWADLWAGPTVKPVKLENKMDF